MAFFLPEAIIINGNNVICTFGSEMTSADIMDF